MAELTRIYWGMQDGAQTTNENFNKLNKELSPGGNVVHNTGDESISGKKTFSDDASFKNISVSGDINQRYVTTSFEIGYGLSVTAKRIGNLVTITFSGSNTVQIGDGAKPTEKIPLGYRPIEAESLDPEILVRHINGTYYFNPNGSISYDGEIVKVSSYFRGVRSYFTKDPWPTA